MTINSLQVEWDQEGCVARAEGFSGFLLTCPRCQALLPRAEDHRCGNKAGESAIMTAAKPKKVRGSKP